MRYLGSLNLGGESIKPRRQNDPDLERILEKHKIQFEQTHAMNSPNVQAAYSAVRRFPKAAVECDEETFQRAWLWVEELIHPYWSGAKVGSQDDVVHVYDLELAGKMAGTPWLFSGLIDKLTLYHDPCALEWMENEWSENLRHRASLAQVTVKKEILPLKKLTINKLRNVMAVDGAHNMWNQRLCYHLHKKFNNHPFSTRSALGWTPFRHGMQSLAEYWGDKENGFHMGWELDGSSWEAKIWERCLLQIADIKFRALRTEDQTQANHIRMKNVYRMISECPLVMPDGRVYLKGENGAGGNLTGQVGTAHDNTLMLLFTLAYCWIRIMGNDHLGWLKMLRPMCLGDDLTFTVHDSIIDEFNGPRLAECAWIELGVVFESPCWEARPFYELGFLSMHFRWDSEYNCYFHRVDRDKLFSSLLQGGTNRTPAEQLQRICGLRNSSWGDAVVRQELFCVYQDYLQLYDSQLRGTDSWETAKKSFVSDHALEAIYYGFQRGPCPYVQCTDWTKIDELGAEETIFRTQFKETQEA